MNVASLAPLRVCGAVPPLEEVVALASEHSLPMLLSLSASYIGEEFAQVDPSLRVEPGRPDDSDPASGLTYAGYSPSQRGRFLAWCAAPQSHACPAFQQLLLANLEAGLCEGGERACSVRKLLAELEQSASWQPVQGLWRVALLARWLEQDGLALAEWLTQAALPADLAGVALGLQALLGAALTAGEARAVSKLWQLPAADLSEATLAFRLRSLAATLSTEPLQFGLKQLGPAAEQRLPWRCHHRDLRIEMPHPNIRRGLEPLLVDLALSEEPPDSLGKEATDPDAASGQKELAHTYLVVEFRQSRSEYFLTALRQAQRRSTFLQLLDEDRHLVYRVTFRKNELNYFWQLWNYVHSWSTTRIYCNGQELQNWQVYPYSQYLR
ncbi:MAG: hypothetical protein ACKO4U_17300 [Caldilinea sp.]